MGPTEFFRLLTSYTIDTVVKRAESFSELEQGWDGYGGRPIHQDTIDSSIKILKNIYEQTNHVFYPDPSPLGMVDLVGYTDDDEDSRIEILVSGEGTIEVLCPDGLDYNDLSVDEFCSNVVDYLPELTKLI